MALLFFNLSQIKLKITDLGSDKNPVADPSHLHLSFYSFRGQYLFKPRPGETPKDHKFYRSLYPQIIQDIEVSSFKVLFCH